MYLRKTKFALLLGSVNGVLFSLIYLPISKIFVSYLYYIKDDNYVHVELPEMYRIARDSGELLVWILLFTVASYTAHHFWAVNLKSTTILWIRVAVIAMAIPILGLWVLRLIFVFVIFVFAQLDICLGPIACHNSTYEVLLMFVRESLNIKFELLLFFSSIILNCFYGVIITKVSNRFLNKDITV